MASTRRSSTVLVLALATAGALLTAVPGAVLPAAPAVVLTAAPAGAGTSAVDPTALPRGPDPRVAYLVHDTIRDGDARIPATTRGRHDALWVVDGGYVVRDHDVGRHRSVRVTFVSDSGRRRAVARSHDWIDVAVSEDGSRLAFRRTLGRTGLRSAVTVELARTGRVLAERELRLAHLVAVTRSRVLVGVRLRWRDPATQWWGYAHDRWWRIAGQAALGADVRHDRLVLARPSPAEFCLRVAPLSRPGRTLWRSCTDYPHQWSPDGRLAVATHTYFDAAGTDRWWVVDGRTGRHRTEITGRLAWDAVWEDDEHFLTLAQSDTGRAAIIRCDVTATCERASRLWRDPVPAEPSVFYASPPVVLADR